MLHVKQQPILPHVCSTSPQQLVDKQVRWDLKNGIEIMIAVEIVVVDGLAVAIDDVTSGNKWVSHWCINVVLIGERLHSDII